MIKSISHFVSRIAVVFLLVMTTVSCEDTESPELSNNAIPQGLHIQYRYNGNDYFLPDPVTINSTNKEIDAFSGSGSAINRVTLYMPLDVVPGTYFITPNPSDPDTFGAYLLIASNGIDILADSGIITVTSVTADTIQGTFSFSGMNGSLPINITHGSFASEF